MLKVKLLVHMCHFIEPLAFMIQEHLKGTTRRQDVNCSPR